MSWDELHKQDRFLPRYPEPAVVRWLSGLEAGRLIDIGCGSGRHTKLAIDMGWRVAAVDNSQAALDRTLYIIRNVAVAGDSLHNFPMTSLSFQDERFEAALSFGNAYYGTWPDMQQAVKEMHRVLKSGGHALVNLRTTEDSRNPRGYQTEPVTLTLEGDQPESGMVMTFVPEGSLYPLFSAFSSMTFERNTVTRNERTWRDDDWLVYLTR